MLSIPIVCFSSKAVGRDCILLAFEVVFDFAPNRLENRCLSASIYFLKLIIHEFNQTLKYKF